MPTHQELPAERERSNHLRHRTRLPRAHRGAIIDPVYEADTIPKLLQRGAAPDPALTAPGRRETSYRSLRDLIERTGRILNRFGISAADRVAIVLPNGPEMAGAFLA